MDKSKNNNFNSDFIKKYPLVFKKYRPIKKIANGSISEIFSGINIQNKEKVAIKIEKRNIMNKKLESECYALFSLRSIGIPKVLTFGYNKEYDILIMPLLGKTLLSIFESKNLNYEFKDICLIAIQIIERIQWVHCRKIIHRDIKPDNFLIGLTDPQIIYLIDFGLSKKYQSSVTGKHIKCTKLKKFTGTPLFGSVNALMCMEQSRKDDLESIGYMLIYFMKGRLPWQGLKVDNKRINYFKIGQMKKEILPEVLCENLPVEFKDYMKYVRSLKFEETPNYSYLRNLFVQLMKRQGFEEGTCFFSWINLDNTNIRFLKRQINLSKKSSSRKRVISRIMSTLENSKRSLSEKRDEYLCGLANSNNYNSGNIHESKDIYKDHINRYYFQEINKLNNETILGSSGIQNSFLKANYTMKENSPEATYKNKYCLNSISIPNNENNKGNSKILLNSPSNYLNKDIKRKNNNLYNLNNLNNYENMKKSSNCMNFKGKVQSPINIYNNNLVKLNTNSSLYNKNKSFLTSSNYPHKRVSSINNCQNQQTILITRNTLNNIQNMNNNKSFHCKKKNNNIIIINNNIYPSNNNLSYSNTTKDNQKKFYHKKDSQKNNNISINNNNIRTSRVINFNQRDLKRIKLFNIFSPQKNNDKKNTKQNITIQPYENIDNSPFNNELENEINRFNQRYNYKQRNLNNNYKVKKIKIPKMVRTIQSTHNKKYFYNKSSKGKYNSIHDGDNNCIIY